MVKQKKQIRTNQTKVGSKLNPLALGYTAAILSAACMLLVGTLGRWGIYGGAAKMMMGWHMFFSFNLIGMLIGIIEGAIWGFVLAYAFGWLYNKFV